MTERTLTSIASSSDILLKTIGNVDRPGSICTSGDLPMTMPGLEVDGVGQVAFPVMTTQARALIKRGIQAPYGKGSDTLVDTSVRRVWELDPDRFTLTNPRWNEMVASITDRARTALGLEEETLEPHLYKLLVYEKGGFFLSHRDGEKLDRMVATLVIALPAHHTGGELVITHEGKRFELSFSGAASGTELSYAAFYADCEHQVLPVRDGYRVCLVYNLTLARSRRETRITAPRTDPIVEKLRELLGDWPPDDEISKLAITLDHQYTQDGLSVDTLKGVDRARAEVLFDAAEKANCVAHLALLTHWQHGSAEGGDYGYGGRRSERWISADDETTLRQNAHTMGEVHDYGLSIDHWSDRHGKTVAFGEMTLRTEEIVSTVPYEDWEISREDFEGYTGNAGMTLNRWYHRAAIVIWPNERKFAILCDAGTDAAISGLRLMIDQCKCAPQAEQQHQCEQCLEFATAIMNTWAPRRHGFHSYSVQKSVDRSMFLASLQELGSPEPVCRFLTQVMPSRGELQIGEGFPDFCKRHRWPTFEEGLSAILVEASPETIERNVTLLEMLCVVRDRSVSRLAVCARLAERTVIAIKKLDETTSRDTWEMRKVDRSALLCSLVRSIMAVDGVEPMNTLIDHTMSHGAIYDLTKAHLTAIFGLESLLIEKIDKMKPVISRWLAHCRSELQQRTIEAPVAPTDFRRAGELPCHCPDCAVLSKFLTDPLQSVHHFRVRQDRRSHLHGIIDENRCDLTHVTLRSSNPQTLVCTKNTASYEAACQTYSRDCENLARLIAIEEKVTTGGDRRDPKGQERSARRSGARKR